MSLRTCADCRHCVIEQQRTMIWLGPGGLIDKAYEQPVCTLLPGWQNVQDTHYCGSWAKRADIVEEKE